MKVAPYFGVIDIGNSGLKASLAETATKRLVGKVQSIHWHLPNAQNKTPPVEFDTQDASWASIDDVVAIERMFERLASTVACVDKSFSWKISSVQPQALATFEKSVALRSTDVKNRIVEYGDIPMSFDVEDPASVGIDRLLTAWGAWQSSAKDHPLIIIQAGTAVTVDWVTERGAYGGGAILPGLSLTLKYLALGTAHLPWLAPPKDPNHVTLPGKNTREAILAGVAASFVGGIERLQRRYRELYEGDPNSIETIVSGGDGLALSRAITSPFKLIDHLVLNALAQLDIATS